MAYLRESAIRDMREFLSYDPKDGHFYWKNDGECAEHSDPHGYLLITGFGRHTVRAHRLAWLVTYGEFPPGDLDHINGNKADNRIENLRIATRSENNQNKVKAHKNSKTGLLGVSPGRSGKYRANIRLNHKQIYLGEFKTPEEAHAAYMAEKVKIHRFRENVPEVAL